ncbi:MAG: myxococcus cysteine-rich repeat containing protein, partial [Candidatus Peribacteraceae bacterium]
MRKPLIRTAILIAVLTAGLAVVVFERQYQSADKTGPLTQQRKSVDVRGQLVSIGRMQSKEVTRVTFPGTTVSETLVQNKVYVINVPDDPAVPTLTLDQAILLSGDSLQPVNYFGYKYVSADGAAEAAHRDDPSFLSRFPGQFFTSAQARVEDAQFGNIISQFELSRSITMGSTGIGGVSLQRNSRYIVIVNESQPVTFNIRRPVICGDGLKEGTEACDDNNFTLGDGCSSTCTVES